jgi:hypothetical protein
MSLAIDPAQVTAVLLVDGWHHVHGGSFDLEAYEYVAPQPGLLLFNGEQAATLSPDRSPPCWRCAGMSNENSAGHDRALHPIPAVLC